MPQMAPMSWLILYIMFMCMFMLMIILNYYSFIYMPNNSLINKNNFMKKMNWKW